MGVTIARLDFSSDNKAVRHIAGRGHYDAMKKTDFDALLERYLNGTASHAEKVKIEAWLDSRKTIEERNSIWTPDEEDRLFKKISDSILHPATESEIPGRRIPAGLIWKIAAVVALVAGVTWATTGIFFKSSSAAEFTAAEQPRKVFLADGTIIWLSPQSVLRYNGFNEKGERDATLTGEGIFEVAKDAAHPFVIRCGKANVKVLGTSFHLKAAADQLMLEVFTGRVTVLTTHNAREVSAMPQERVILNQQNEIFKEAFSRASVVHLAANTEYNMGFENVPMEQVIARMEKKFNVRFSVQNAAMRHCRITADLTDRSLVRSLEMLSELINVDYKIEGSSVALTGAGCQNQ